MHCTAALQYRANGGSWNAVTTPASSSTALTLTAAGIAITCQNLTYSTDNKLAASPNLSKWNIYDPSASCGWSTLYAASKTDLDALVASGVAAYTPLAGVSRYTYDETSFQPFNASVVSTLRNGPQYSTQHAYVIRNPSGSVTLKLNTTGLGTAIGLPVRVLLQDMSGALLQEWAFQPPLSTPAVVSDITLTQPAGNYRLVVIDVPFTNSLSFLQVPENVALARAAWRRASASC